MGTNRQQTARTGSKQQRRTTAPDPYLITISRAAEIAGVHRNTFTDVWWDPDADGWQIGPTLVPAVHIGTVRRVPRIALEQALALAAT